MVEAPSGRMVLILFYLILSYIPVFGLPPSLPYLSGSKVRRGVPWHCHLNNLRRSLLIPREITTSKIIFFTNTLCMIFFSLLIALRSFNTTLPSTDMSTL